MLITAVCLIFFESSCLAKISNEFYKKEDIHIKLPLLFKEYDKVLINYPNANYLYPGSFAIDSKDNIYIYYVFEPKQNDTILVCYRSDGVYQGYYRISNGGPGGGGEGISVTLNELNRHAVYVVSNNGVLQEYDFDSRFYGDKLLKKQDFPVNVYNQFSMNNKFLLIETYTEKRKINSARNILELYSRDLSLMKRISLPMMYSGYVLSTVPDAENYNKRQGIALGNDFFVASYGGFFYPKMKSTINTYQGIRAFDFSGRMLWEKMFAPKALIVNFEKIGLSPSRIENEGIVVKDDYIYTMYIYSDRFHKKISYNEGVVIFKESAK